MELGGGQEEDLGLGLQQDQVMEKINLSAHFMDLFSSLTIFTPSHPNSHLESLIHIVSIH